MEGNGKHVFIWPLTVVFCITTIAFAVLWNQARQRPPVQVVKIVEKPVEVIKEVPKEVIKEVPVEKIKEVIKEIPMVVEVPAKLTEQQQIAIEFVNKYLAAKPASSQDDALGNFDGIRVVIYVEEAIKRVISEDRIKNKFELILRKSSIKIDDKSSFSVTVSIAGSKNPDPEFYIYSTSIQFVQPVVVGRNEKFRTVSATLWQDGSFGFAGTKRLEGMIMEAIETMGESFANKYLAAQEKDKAAK